MLKIYAVILRNFKLLLRSRSSGLIIILGPLLLIFLVGLAFNTSSLYSINLGVYRPDHTELSEAFIDELIASQISVTEFNTHEECVQSVRWGATHVCMEFPPDFEVRTNKTNEITFYADTSQVNLVYMVLDAVSSQVATTSTELTAGLTDIILSAVSKTRETIADDNSLLTTQGAQRTKAFDEEDAARTALNRLNLNVPDSGLDELEDGTGNFEDQIDELSDAGSDAVAELKDLINKVEDNAEDIINDIEDLEPPDQMSIDDAEAILNFINDSLDALVDIEERLDDAEGNASGSIDELDDLIEDAGKSFSRAAYLIEKAALGRTHVKENLDAIWFALNESEHLAQQMIQNHNELLAVIDAIPVTSAQSIARPITTSIEPVTSERSNLSYLYPSLIMLVLMFICLLLSSTLVIMERKSLATFRNFCTPTKDISFTMGTYFTTLLVVALQLTIILGVSATFFKAQFVLDFFTLAIILFVLSTLFIFLGMAIGNFFSTEETVTLATISIGSLFLLLSDLILPVESMPAQFAEIAAYNPFIIGSDLLKQVILFDFGFFQVLPSLLVILGYAGAIFVITFVIQKFMKRRFLKLYARFNLPKKEKQKIIVVLDAKQNLNLDGKTVKSMGELVQEIRKMKEDTYSSYVTEKKNVFADWVRLAYDDPELAGKLSRQINHQRQMHLLMHAHKVRERLRKKKR